MEAGQSFGVRKFRCQNNSNFETIQCINFAGCIVLDPWFARPEMALVIMMLWAIGEARAT